MMYETSTSSKVERLQETTFRYRALTLFTSAILCALLLLSCSKFDYQDPSTIDGYSWVDAPASSSTLGTSSSTAVSSSIVGTSSSTAASSSIVGTSSSTEASSSSIGASSAVGTSSMTVTHNTQICPYTSLTATKGQIDCLEKTYNTVVIGTGITAQTWLAQDLAWLPAVNAKSDNSDTVAKYYVNGYDGTDTATAKAANNYNTYGVLYNYKAALSACPSGWHLPDTTDWNTLEAYVDANNGTNGIGSSLKAVSGWTAYSGITNSDGFSFSALPGGYYSGSNFGIVGDNGSWWTATANASSVSRRFMYHYSDIIYHGVTGQSNGFSVRCLAD